MCLVCLKERVTPRRLKAVNVLMVWYHNGVDMILPEIAWGDSGKSQARNPSRAHAPGPAIRVRGLARAGARAARTNQVRKSSGQACAQEITTFVSVVIYITCTYRNPDYCTALSTELVVRVRP